MTAPIETTRASFKQRDAFIDYLNAERAVCEDPDECATLDWIIVNEERIRGPKAPSESRLFDAIRNRRKGDK